jgi:molybdopterin converting factor small subunit
VHECIDDLVKQFPALKEIIFDKKGNMYRYFDIYINGESSYPDELSKPVKDEDVLHIVMLLHGG